MRKPPRVAVVGATGLVGRCMLEVLLLRKFPTASLEAVASHRSAGGRLEVGGKALPIRDLEKFDFAQTDLALFSAGAAQAREHAPRAAKHAVVVDNSSAFRMDESVPLVVPEINAHALRKRPRNIIANPNCSTIQLTMALAPLHRLFELERVDVATYQSISGAGGSALAALKRDMRNQTLSDDSLASNVIARIDLVDEDGWSREEKKLLYESRKILEEPDLALAATAVRVPVWVGHSEAVHIRCVRPVDIEAARAALREAPGLNLDYELPTPVGCAGRDEVFVGRLRRDPSDERRLQFWVVADNIRKGAALNAVQIAECLVNSVR